MKQYLATVRLGGQLVKTLVYAESSTHARLLLQYQFGMDCISASPVQTNEAPADATLLDDIIKPKPPLTPPQARIKGLQQNVERSKQQLQAERDRQRRQRDVERKQNALKRPLGSL